MLGSFEKRVNKQGKELDKVKYEGQYNHLHVHVYEKRRKVRIKQKSFV